MGGEEFGGPGFRRGRKAGRGDVRAAIIALLAEEPMHGYQIMTEITDRSGGVWRPSPGSVYPTLQALEDQGLVTVTTAEGRRVYQLTDDGRQAAEALGDGPAPWDVAARRGDRSERDLRGLVAEVAYAMAQVVRTGDTDQVNAARDILADTRRRLYLVLADGPTGEPAAPGSAEGRRDVDGEGASAEDPAGP
ncbi:MAG TPA: PadR family transcriptional regulator [Acidimicrobiales bacterium]|nr:PadR family transcriptional regulator [Acidimicrobiales bacterium]